MIFYDYLKRIKSNSEHFPTSLIVETSNCCDFIFLVNEYLKTLLCNSMNPYCNCCEICNKINSNNYFDLIFLDNEKEKITKEDIIKLQETFSKPSVEKYKVKLYAIKGIEDCNKQVVNSLLKFIEDGCDNVYALFFTTNYNKIIPTILSRSNIIKIQDKSVNLSMGIDGENSDVINFVFDDYDNYQKVKEEINFDLLVDKAKKYSSIKNIKEEAELVIFMASLKKEEYKLFLKCLMYYVDISKKVFIMDIYNKWSLNINLKSTAILIANFIRGNNENNCC